MKVLGANLGSNLDGKQLKDGGACVIVDGKIEVAIAEERLSRIKNDGGFARSVPYCLDYLDLSLHDLDAIVISSCLDPMRYDKHAWGFNELDQNKIHYVSHHLSHAYSSFLVSSFEEAIIIVIDSGGNFLENCNEVSDEWWKYKREQNSYYIARVCYEL
jgi:carbamoyltransferase